MGVSCDLQLVEQTVDQLGKAVERICAFDAIQHIALAGACTVEDDHMAEICLDRDQVEEHVRTMSQIRARATLLVHPIGKDQ